MKNKYNETLKTIALMRDSFFVVIKNISNCIFSST